MIPMNMFKSNGGFTLVELIVVIAILAILAGVAVPAYSGYIKNANETSDNQALEAVETAMIAALGMEGKQTASSQTYFELKSTTTNGKTVQTLNGKDLNGTEAGLGNKVWDNFVQFYGCNSTEGAPLEFKFYTSAKFDSTGVVVGVEPTK